MMFFLHLWGFISFWICVCFFTFLTGYTYYFTVKKDLQYSLNKILQLYITYWVVLIILGTIGVLLFNYKYSFIDILLELSAIKTSTVFFAWYVRVYVFLMLIAPVYARYKPHKPLTELVLYSMLIPSAYLIIRYLIYPGTILHEIKQIFCWIPPFFIGYMFAEHRLFERIDGRIKRIISVSRIRYAIIMFIAIDLIIINNNQSIEQTFVKGQYLMTVLNLILYPVLFCVTCFCLIYIAKYLRIRFLSSILSALGAESAVMWFLHNLFFIYDSPFLYKLIYFSDNPIIVTVWVLILIYPPSLAIHKSIKYLSNKDHRIIRK